MLLDCGSVKLDLTTPLVMGVLNVTPDSFSDGGQWLDPARALERCAQMVDEGARIIDVGGESTRPGAATVSVEEELRRVLPVIEAVAKRFAIPISIDSSRAAVMLAAVNAGAVLINDIRALRESDALSAAVNASAGICLMHMQGDPVTMQSAPRYGDVVADVRQFLVERLAACEKAGVNINRIAIDPGIGFGKSVEHNLDLLARLGEFRDLGRPILVGISRKSTIGAVTGRPVNERMAGGVAFATAAVLSGASIIRAHDVAATVDAVKVAMALRARARPA
jgi:dihydropteroate synthase